MITKLSRGRYQADYYDADGIRRRPIINASNVRDAEKEVQRLSRLCSSAQVTTMRGMSLGEALRKAQIEHYQARGSRNMKAISSISGQLEKFFGSNTPLKVISDDKIESFVYHCLEKGLSNATVNRKLALLSKVLKLATRWTEPTGTKVLREMPVMSKLPEKRGRIRVYTLEEQEAILGCIQEELYRDFIEMLFETGMRSGELTGIQNGRIENAIVDARALQGYYAYSEANWNVKRIHIWGSKTDRPRTLPMTPRATQILEKYKDTKAPFASLSQDMLSYRWRKVRAALGTENEEDFVMYAIRHTVATRLWESSGDIYMVQQWLGHEDISTTQIYTHISSPQLDKAAQMLSGFSRTEMDSTVNGEVIVT